MSAVVNKDAGLIKLAEVSAQDLLLNKKAIEAGREASNAKRVATWFLPVVNHALKGGVRTAFMLAQEFTRNWGTLNIFVIYSFSGADVDVSELSRSLRTHFPDLRFVVTTHRRGRDRIETLPASDFAFCTLWTTAYVLLKYNQTKAKYYLMQDFEPSFYSAGSVYGVIEQTYRFGFSCIANTPGVGNRYRTYSSDVVEFSPGVDRDVFYPDENKSKPGDPYVIAFYGRPSNQRNCFELGADLLIALKKRLDKKVRIVSAGENWSPSSYGLQGVVENLGLLGSMEEVGRLYRQADVGLVYMMTPHPSYQPLEYMASGCVVATNINEANRWLLNEQNSIQIEPFAEVAAERICSVLSNPVSWSMMRDRGLASIASLSWGAAFKVVRDRLESR